MKYIILLGLSLTFPLYAEEAPSGGEKPKEKPDFAAIFKKKDKDGDGFLSKEEFTAHAKDAAKAGEAFTKLDKNSDNKLSEAEFVDRGGKGGKKGGKKDKDAGEKDGEKEKSGGEN